MEPEITVIIIDDDLGSIQKLQNDLLAFSEVRILDTATTAELDKRHILKYQPDLVFLDVELPDMSGFDLLDDIEKELGIKAGHTTEDLRFTLETVACIGACGLAPVMQVNEDTHGRLTPDKLSAILAKYQ